MHVHDPTPELRQTQALLCDAVRVAIHHWLGVRGPENARQARQGEMRALFNVQSQ